MYFLPSISTIRSGTSIGANIVEAQAGSSKKDFTNFYFHSLKSANETKFWLGLIRDSAKGDKIRADNLLKEVTEIANILGASIVTLKKKQ
jgi:four helix bundle protein